MIADIRGLTIRQPWASLICPGPRIAPVKTIETARPKWSYRGWVLIHAGKARPPCSQWEDGPFDDIGDHQYGGHLVSEDEPWGSRRVDGWWLSLAPDHRAYLDLPLGAVIGVARITDCVPVVADLGGPDDPMPRVCVTSRGLKLMRPFVFPSEDISDQEPYGDFTPGTHALLLADIVSLPRPIPATGRLGLWNPDAQLVAAAEAQIGTRP